MENIMECQMEFLMGSSTMVALFTMVYPQGPGLHLQCTSLPPHGPAPLSEPQDHEPVPDTEPERPDSLT